MRTHRILHLSDTHVSRTGIDEDGVDAVAALERMLHDARHVRDLDLVVVSGDIADDGSVDGYLVVRERIGAFAAQRGIPHVYCTGNHDYRDAFGAVLGTGHLGADGPTEVRSARPASGRRSATREGCGSSRWTPSYRGQCTGSSATSSRPGCGRCCRLRRLRGRSW